MRLYFPNRLRDVGFDLACGRIILFLVLVLTTWDLRFFAALAAQPEFVRVQDGLSLPGVYQFSAYIPHLASLYNVALICGLFGLLTPLACCAAAVIFIICVSYSFSFGFHSHHFLPLTMLLIMLIFSGSGHHLSIDRWLMERFRLRRTRGLLFRQTLALKSLRILFVSLVFLSGLAKLRFSGLQWASSNYLRNVFIIQNLVSQQRALFDFQSQMNAWVSSTVWFPQMLAYATLLLDLLAPSALFSRRLYFKFLVSFFLFQVSVFVLMYINFSPWAALYGFWIPWANFVRYPVSSLRLRVARRQHSA